MAISRKGILVIKPTQDTFVLAWRKGAHEQKSEHCRLRRLTGQKRSNRGTPKDTFVLLGRRSMQAKDRRLSLATIDWSKTKHTTCVRLVDNAHNNKYNILNSQAMRNKSSAGRHQERKPFGCKVFWINAGKCGFEPYGRKCPCVRANVIALSLIEVEQRS